MNLFITLENVFSSDYCFDVEISAKVLYPEWKEKYREKINDEFQFDVPYQNESLLEIKFPEEVPWGTSIDVKGTLSTKERKSNFKNFLSNKGHHKKRY